MRFTKGVISVLCLCLTPLRSVRLHTQLLWRLKATNVTVTSCCLLFSSENAVCFGRQYMEAFLPTTRGTAVSFFKPEEGYGNNRSVMPLDVPGCTRDTLITPVSIYVYCVAVQNIFLRKFVFACRLNLLRKYAGNQLEVVISFFISTLIWGGVVRHTLLYVLCTAFAFPCAFVNS